MTTTKENANEINILKSKIIRIERVMWYVAALATYRTGELVIPTIKAWLGIN